MSKARPGFTDRRSGSNRGVFGPAGPRSVNRFNEPFQNFVNIQRQPI